jgi:excisionase family DNA binding protein
MPRHCRAESPRDRVARVNLDLYCSVSEACTIAGVSDGYMRRLIREGKVQAQRFGNSYAVLRSDAVAFQRQPGMGRPRQHRSPASKPGRPAATRRKPRRK